MKNDYDKNCFWVKKVNNKKIYYIKVKKQWVKVNKQIYTVCKNSYQKMNYEMEKEKNVSHYSDINNINLYNQYYDYDFVNEIFIQDIMLLLKNAIESLSHDEVYISVQLYFKEKTERQLAKELGVSQQSLHYYKKSILKKLRDILLKYI